MDGSREMDGLRWWMIPAGILLLPIVLMGLALATLFVSVWIVAVLIWIGCRSVLVHLGAWSLWNARGRDVLFVCSDSPVWKLHVDQNLLPLIHERAVVLNWSHRRRWRFGLATMAFTHFGGHREFNPMAVVFRPFHRTRVFRFWQPFRDWKHGNVRALTAIETEFLEVLGLERQP